MERTSARPGLVVVGACLAGLRAVEAARRAGFTGAVTLIGREPELPYDRPPLSKAYLAGEEATPTYYVDREHLEGLDVDLRLGLEATALDPAAHTVTAGGETISYSKLVIATGADPRPLIGLPPISGMETLRTLDDAHRIRRALRDAHNVVVVGAGFIGAEIASSAKSLGATVTIIEAAPVPLVRAVGEAVGSALADLHRRNDVRLLCGTHVDSILGEGRVEAVGLGNGERIDADLVIVGVGAVPATGWLEGSGIELHPGDGGVICDAYLRTSEPDVYAAGDLVHWPNDLMDTTMRLENWTNAADQGTQAAINALFPEQAREFGTVPYFWSDWYGQRIQFVGTAVADEVRFADGGAGEDTFVALFRTGDRLVGAATLNAPRKIMKLRRIISQRGTVDDALALLAPLVRTGR